MKSQRDLIVWVLTFAVGTLAAYLVILLAGLLLFVCAERAHGQPLERVELIFRTTQDSPQGRAIAEAAGGEYEAEDRALRLHLIRVPVQAEERVRDALSRRHEVEFVERNAAWAPAWTPNDPRLPQQWALAKLDLRRAWDLAKRNGSVTIAILDTGCDGNHEDLQPVLVPGRNVFDGNDDTKDVFGHGTPVAGMAAAVTDNGKGISGPAASHKIMPIRVAGLNGYASTWTLSTGLSWAADHGARVANMSFEGIAESQSITTGAQYLISKGGVVIAASGNCGCERNVAENPYMISVGATTASDTLAGFSTRGRFVDLVAPGESVLGLANGGGYAHESGTSFAAPIVAGVVALLLDANPALRHADVERILKQSALDLGAPGYDTSFGAGRVDAYRALRLAVPKLPQCSDGIDNDGDFLIDYGQDPHCSSGSDDDERRGACGLGFELAFVLLLLRAFRYGRGC